MTPPQSALGKELWTRYKSSSAADVHNALWRGSEPSYQGPVNSLVEDALRAFDSGAYAGATLAARAALEAACYLFLTRSHVDLNGGTSKLYLPKTPKGEDAVTRFEGLAKELCGRDVLSSENCKALWRIKEHGDIAAHLVERDSKSLAKPIKYPRKGRIMPWDSQSKQDLIDTIAILEEIADSIVRRPHLMGPSAAMLGTNKNERPEGV